MSTSTDLLGHPSTNPDASGNDDCILHDPDFTFPFYVGDHDSKDKEDTEDEQLEERQGKDDGTEDKEDEDDSNDEDDAAEDSESSDDSKDEDEGSNEVESKVKQSHVVFNGAGLSGTTTDGPGSFPETKRAIHEFATMFPDLEFSASFVALAVVLAKKKKRSYSSEAFYIVRVVQEQLGCKDLQHYLSFRAWIAQENVTRGVFTEYRKLKSCFEKADPEQKTKMRNFYAVLDAFKLFTENNNLDARVEFAKPSAMKAKICSCTQVVHFCYVAFLSVFYVHVDMSRETGKPREFWLEHLFGQYRSRKMAVKIVYLLLWKYPTAKAVSDSKEELTSYINNPNKMKVSLLAWHKTHMKSDEAAYRSKMRRGLECAVAGNKKISFSTDTKTSKKMKELANVLMRARLCATMDSYDADDLKRFRSKRCRVSPNKVVVPNKKTKLSGKELHKTLMDKVATLNTCVGVEETEQSRRDKPLHVPPSNNLSKDKDKTTTRDRPLPKESTPDAHLTPSIPVASVLTSNAVATQKESRDRARSNGEWRSSFETDIDGRFSTCTFAGNKEILATGGPNVRIEMDSEIGGPHTFAFDMSSKEFYSATNLDVCLHGQEYGPVATPGRRISNLPQITSCVTPDISVLRGNHPLFLKYFDKIGPQPLGRLVKFVLSNPPKPDPNRDGDQPHTGGRVNFGGGGGQDYQPSGRMNASGDKETSMPALLTGFHIFELADSANNSGSDEKEFVRCFIGILLDLMQQCADDLHENYLKIAPAFNNPYREQLYAAVFRAKLLAECFRNETAAVQVKCLSRYDFVDLHLDVKNCNWTNFNITNSLCWVLEDSRQCLWSVKIIANSRKAIGDYVESLADVSNVVANVNGFIKVVQEEYKKFQADYRSSGQGWPHDLKNLCWYDPSLLFLDKYTSYDRLEWDGHSLQVVNLTSGVTRDTWLSSFVHWLYRRRLSETVDNFLMFALIACYQNSVAQFWPVMERLQKEELGPSEYDRVSHEMFNGFIGGPLPRYSSSGISFQRVYYSCDDGKADCRRKCVLDALKSLLEWVKEFGDSASTNDFRLKLQETSNRINHDWIKLNPSKVTELRHELAEFRLTLFVHLVLLTGYLPSGAGIIEKVYPVLGLGSYKHLVDVGKVKESDIEIGMRLVGMGVGLNPYRQSYMEQLLCEGQLNENSGEPIGRGVRDLLVRESDLFMLLLEDGGKVNPSRKPYGEIHRWTKIACSTVLVLVDAVPV